VAAAGRDPVPPVRACAEWEPAFGTLIRWPLGIPGALVAALAEDDSVYVLVETANQETSARAAFAAYGVDLDHVRFVYALTYSHWTRDWGPLSVFDGDGAWGITDPIFNGYPWVPGCETEGGSPAPADRRADARGFYDEDNLVNGVLATVFGCPLHALPAYCTGGNIMVDGHGAAFSSRQMLQENLPELTEEEFRALAEAYLGIADYHFFDNPEVHGIQHIDCFAKLLDEETILVKQVAPDHPEYACVERLADDLATRTSCYGRPYRIVRVYCGPYSGTATAAYTNSLILNRKVLVPLFGIDSDAGALATYAAAMPGYEVLGFPHGTWYYYDALHCRTMGIFDREMLLLWHRRLDPEVPAQPVHEILVRVDDRSEAGLIADELRVQWRVAGETEWRGVPLFALAAADSFRAEIPGQAPGTTVEYFVTAADSSGRRESLPRTAPAGFYAFTVAADPSGAAEANGSTAVTPVLEVGPSPCTDRLWIRARLPAPAALAVDVLDPAGRLVRRLEAAAPAGPSAMLIWDGRDSRGALCVSGVYWLCARGAPRAAGRPCIWVR